MTPEDEDNASIKLSSLFNDENQTVRVNALYAYGRVRKKPTSEEISLLIDLLKDKNYLIRSEAAEALGHLKATTALAALKQMVEDEKGVYPWACAIGAILQIEPSFFEVVKENWWEYPYIALLQSEDVDERKIAVNILKHIGTEIALPFLKEIYDNYENEKKKGISGGLFYAIYDIEDRIKRKTI